MRPASVGVTAAHPDEESLTRSGCPVTQGVVRESAPLAQSALIVVGSEALWMISSPSVKMRRAMLT